MHETSKASFMLSYLQFGVLGFAIVTVFCWYGDLFWQAGVEHQGLSPGFSLCSLAVWSSLAAALVGRNKSVWLCFCCTQELILKVETML